MSHQNSQGILNQTMNVKIVLLGEGCVGKTSLVLRYIQNVFNDGIHSPTLQASYLKKSITIDQQRVNLNLWDTAGQERFHALGPIYYRDSDGALLVYDVTDEDSLNKVKSWVKELRKILGQSVIITVVGNKIDLIDRSLLSKSEDLIKANHKIISDGESYCQTIKCDHFLTSAKTGRGIDQTFLALAKKIIVKKNLERKASIPNGNMRGIRVAEDNEEENQVNQNQSKCSCWPFIHPQTDKYILNQKPTIILTTISLLINVIIARHDKS